MLQGIEDSLRAGNTASSAGAWDTGTQRVSQCINRTKAVKEGMPCQPPWVQSPHRSSWRWSRPRIQKILGTCHIHIQAATSTCIHPRDIKPSRIEITPVRRVRIRVIRLPVNPKKHSGNPEARVAVQTTAWASEVWAASR